LPKSPKLKGGSLAANEREKRELELRVDVMNDKKGEPALRGEPNDAGAVRFSG
jgi:hypothetical protein